MKKKPHPRDSISDEMWAALLPALPKGVHKQSCRLFVEALVFRLRTGCPWRDLPERFGHWHAVWTRQSHWAKKGWMGDIFEAIKAQLGPDMSHASLDSTSVKLHLGAHGSRAPKDGSEKKNPKAEAAEAGTPRFTPS
jgi:transposase